MANKYDTSKFEEALKDIDRWLVRDYGMTDETGVWSTVIVDDAKMMGEYFRSCVTLSVIGKSIVTNGIELPINPETVYDFKRRLCEKFKHNKMIYII